MTNNIVDLHTDAITALLEGKEDDSIAHLLRCLTLAKSAAFDTSPGLCSSASKVIDSDRMDTKPCIFEVSLEEVIHACEDASVLKRSAAAGNVQLYRHVFGVDGLDAITDRPTLIQFVAIVSYNLGMIYNERASLRCDFKTLATARSLYVFALQLISSPYCEQGILDLTALELAIYNNFGHLCAFFLDFEGYNKCRDRLEQKLASAHQDTLNGPSLDFFRQNCANSRNHIATQLLAPAA